MGAIHSGTWRGIYTHKNVLGSMMSLSSICFLLLTFLNREKKWIPMSGMVLSIILLLGSRSSTPLLNLFIGISALFVSRIVRLPYQLKLSIIFLLASIGFISTAIGSDLGEIFTGVFGKDVTLSGRTEVWSYVWDMIYQRPWLGYGYGALWVDWNSESNYVWKAVNWEAPNAHNGFLEVWLGIGFIGLFVFLLHLLINLFRSLSMIQFLRSAESSFPFLLILLMLLASITESLLLTRNGIYWILYVSVTLYLSRNKEIKDFGSSRSPVITAESSVREENNFIFKDHV